MDPVPGARASIVANKAKVSKTTVAFYPIDPELVDRNPIATVGEATE